MGIVDVLGDNFVVAREQTFAQAFGNYLAKYVKRGEPNFGEYLLRFDNGRVAYVLWDTPHEPFLVTIVEFSHVADTLKVVSFGERMCPLAELDSVAEGVSYLLQMSNSLRTPVGAESRVPVLDCLVSTVDERLRAALACGLEPKFSCLREMWDMVGWP